MGFRVAAFAWLSAAVALCALGGACSESFPALPGPGVDASAQGPNAPLEATPPAIIAPAARVNASSAPVSYDPRRGGVWTANGDVGTVSYVDPVGRAVVQEIPIGQDTRSVAVSPDGTWVATVDYAGEAVTLIDAETRAIARVLPVGGHPRACVWDAANPRWLYVTLEDTGEVAIVDRTLGQVVLTLPVGRLPAGLTVSALRTELYVSHRIDPEVTIVTLDDRQVAAQVTFADEPFTAPAVPNGAPLGFEGMGLTIDGQHLWAPHELLAPSHPLVFNETLFPAISVVDIVNRVEEVTDPNSPNVDGRKNLFDAIEILGASGQPDVFSQLCGVVMHPNTLIGWALACASEDLVTFDVGAGVATDALRDLPCDHPSGLTLDDTGDRIFVVCDASKELLTLDTAGGSLVAHTALYGAPIQVAVDTLAASNPTLRAGRTLFTEANASKGALSTTGNDWMSCGGCHLDGFGSTNARLFEALLPPTNPALDAQIGHDGLVDHFSTAGLAPAPGFNPHDVLSALLDQGGLAPDRTGANRTGQVDPSNPPSTAVTMAQELALVIAGDLPAQPTWLHGEGGPPNLDYDQAWCGQSSCHPSEYAAWSQSVHARSASDAMVQFGVTQEPAYLLPLCAGCHDPVSVRAGDTSLASGRGVTCLACHDVTGLLQGGGNADLQATTHDWTADHKVRAQASLTTLVKPQFCGGCHLQFVSGNALVALSTLDEYATSTYAPSTRCVDCHMPALGTAGVFNHRFPGGNVYLGNVIGDATLLAEQAANLQSVVQLTAERVAGGVLVSLRNGGAGHWFPTGVTDIREPWVELQPLDASGQPLGPVLGGPDPTTNLLPPTAARLGIDLAEADGTPLTLHQLGLATRIPFDVRVPSGEAQPLFLAVPSVPTGTASIEATLLYRNVRTTFYQAATQSHAAAPETVMARGTVAWTSP